MVTSTPTLEPTAGELTFEELQLAARNRGMPLEALRYDVTPAGLHYLLIHFDIPAADPAGWRLELAGLFARPATLGVADLRAMPARTVRATLECAGNGRAHFSPRYPSVPWLEEGVSTAEWTGVPLAALLKEAKLEKSAREIVFSGIDRGIDRGAEHAFERSLSIEEAMHADVLVAYAM